MKAQYELRPSLEPEDQIALARGTESLQFYLYSSPRKCSESRLDQVKKGLSLAKVAKSQECVFTSAANSPSFHNSPSPTDPFTEDFTQRTAAKGLSPAMKKYVSLPTFDRAVERNKHQRLAAYFQVNCT